jgi:hypothetical protein
MAIARWVLSALETELTVVIYTLVLDGV